MGRFYAFSFCHFVFGNANPHFQRCQSTLARERGDYRGQFISETDKHAMPTDFSSKTWFQKNYFELRDVSNPAPHFLSCLDLSLAGAIIQN